MLTLLVTSFAAPFFEKGDCDRRLVLTLVFVSVVCLASLVWEVRFDIGAEAAVDVVGMFPARTATLVTLISLEPKVNAMRRMNRE